ncbi:hypothetical protein NA57DRAFT_55770 [Rhizodiscina lignyota]|uniref:Zn(2)-C6 fungal-type domain-containing protein n=1 Tax=Rhizodiscina lignyota TaxID=1504668 RepID=A0A9P4IDY2_9PEZI|nr:hypothetical protein NA57DRAFT_55770 [Rhizodiscina lignyota]
MPSRRQHTKSRHGCNTCKQRKVRCDQTRPICENCTRLKRECSYPETIISGPYTQSHEPSAASASSSKDAGFGDVSSITEESAQDLELLHHWTMHTSSTMTDHPGMEALWRSNVVVHSFSHRFLLHGLLSLAALHKGYEAYPPDRIRYTDLAKKHHDQALAQYIPLLGSVNEYNCHALFAQSSLVGGMSFGLMQLSNDDEYAPANIVRTMIGSFDLLRGVSVMIEQGQEWIKQGDLSPMIGLENLETILQSPEITGFDGGETFNPLLQQVHSIMPLYEAGAAGLSQEECNVAFTKAVQMLNRLKSLSEMIGNVLKMRSVLAWPALVDESFIRLLKAEDPMALIILSHFAAGLVQLDDIWWLKGIGVRLNNGLAGMIPPQWLPYLSNIS